MSKYRIHYIHEGRKQEAMIEAADRQRAVAKFRNEYTTQPLTTIVVQECYHPDSLKGRLQELALIQERRVLIWELNQLPIDSKEFYQKRNALRNLDQRIKLAKVSDKQVLDEFARAGGLLDIAQWADKKVASMQRALDSIKSPDQSEP